MLCSMFKRFIDFKIWTTKLSQYGVIKNNKFYINYYDLYFIVEVDVI